MNKRANFNVIIPAIRRNLNTLEYVIPYVTKNIRPMNIIIIANSDMKNDLRKFSEVQFFDEDKLMLGLTLEKVSELLFDICGEKKRAGWYFQQFIKMAWAYKCSEENYVVWDADTIPLNQVDFFTQDGKLVFTEKMEYNKPYFETIEKLFSGKVKKYNDKSFIAEHMIINRSYMKQVIDDINNNDSLNGSYFFEKILRAIDLDDIKHSGFSEFETYGNYVMRYYQKSYEFHKLRTLREGVYVIGVYPKKEQLIWAEKDYDIISIEYSSNPRKVISNLTRLKIIRKIFHLRTIVTFRNRCRSFYRKITGKKDLIFD
jgi:hypothetical protein